MATLDQLDMLESLDPMALVDERINEKLNRAVRKIGKEPPRFPALPPAEHQAAVDSLLGKTMGGLQYVGETLDKPGRAVRGLLAGRPGELLNLVPFSDAMKWTDPSKATSGRDLLEKIGVANPNKEGFSPLSDPKDAMGDVAGFGAEVLLDPMTYLTFGASALSKAGKAAKAAGTLEKTVAKRIAAGQGGLAKFHVPFTGIEKTLGTGAGSEAFAGTIGAGLDALGNTRAGRFGKMLFSPRAGDQFSQLGQEVAGVRHDLKPEALMHANRATLDAIRGFEGIAPDFTKEFGQHPERLIQDIVNHAAETGDIPGAFHQFLDKPSSLGVPQQIAKEVSPELLKKTSDLVNTLRGGKDKMFNRVLEIGGNAELLDQGINHMPRYATMEGNSLLHRSDAIGNLPKATVNKILADPLIRQSTPADRVTHLMDRYGMLGPKATQVSEWLNGVPLKQTSMFNHPLLQDLTQYHARVAQTESTLKAAHQVFAKNVTDTAQDSVPLVKAFADVGMKPDVAAQYFASKFGITNPNARIPVEVVNAVKGVMTAQTQPEWMKMAGSVVDYLTNAFKKAVTLPFPSFHTRNFVSGMYANLASGNVNSMADAAAYAKSIATARQQMFKGSPLADDAIVYGLAGKNLGIREIGDIGSVYGALDEAVPGKVFKNHPVDLTKSTYKPLEKLQSIPYVSNPIRKGYGKVMKTGEEAAAQVEWASRVGMFDYLVNHKGWDKLEAAKEVKKLQFDYSELTSAERVYAKRLVPFWSYARKNVPLQFSNLFQRPGGLSAQTARLSNNLRDDSGYVPPHIGEGLAAKIGPDRFVSGLGLPIEQLGEMFAKGPDISSTIGRTLQKGGAMLNPLVKTPIELATDKNLFTGRPLSEMYPFPFPKSMQTANLVLGNSPLGRVSGVANKLLDTKWLGGPTVENGPRKELLPTAVNLLTGGRITDVTGGLDRQQELAFGKAMQDVAAKSDNLGVIQKVYAKRGKPLTLEEERNMRVLTTLEKKRAEVAKKKREWR